MSPTEAEGPKDSNHPWLLSLECWQGCGGARTRTWGHRGCRHCRRQSLCHRGRNLDPLASSLSIYVSETCTLFVELSIKPPEIPKS